MTTMTIIPMSIFPISPLCPQPGESISARLKGETKQGCVQSWWRRIQSMKAELVDIATVITIASGSVTIAHYTIKATKWAWTHRKDFADKLRRAPKDVVISLQ